jgi:hypothetical protein
MLLLLWIFLAWQGQGAATLDDMVQDVADALHFIHSELSLPHRPSADPTSPSKKSPILLGGYSSGGHVVATLLSSQYSDKIKTLQEPEWIQGVFYLSGVLSLDSWLMNAVTLTEFGKWARDIPSPYTQQPQQRRCLPQPSTIYPHLIIGCRYETFGVPVLDATLCAPAYAKWLSSQHHVPARCVLVDSNHWSVLNSRALSVALQENLPWLWDTTNGIGASAKKH